MTKHKILPCTSCNKNIQNEYYLIHKRRKGEHIYMGSASHVCSTCAKKTIKLVDVHRQKKTLDVNL